MAKQNWDYRTIRRTNEPGTCLYCGRPLPVYCWDQTVRFREQNESDEGWQGRLEEMEKAGWKLTIMRNQGKTAYFQKQNPRRGVFGYGAFHSGQCAQHFGLAFAKQQYRLKPYSTDEEE